MTHGNMPSEKLRGMIHNPDGIAAKHTVSPGLALSYALIISFFMSGTALSQTLPTNGSVAAGSASISSPGAGTLNINQSSNQAIINWQSFSVGAGGTVNFNQPGASSATLNRVTGSTPSSIAGTINAPGTVILVNPNGIAFTKSGVVNTGSFAASTLDIKNEDFLAGRYKFSGNGSSATVTNAGRINVSDGGFAALLGGRVANDGVITARLGKIGLASGEMVTLDMSGDGFVSVAVPSNQLGNIMDSTGKALVSNKGKIRADGGTVFLSAATASTLLRDAVNVPGSIRANSVGTHNGRIVISGGAGGRVKVSGRLAAKGKSSNTSGGRIDISGADIALASAKISASGQAGGGKIRIGGDEQGTGDFQHALSLSIDSATVISADALDKGNGGTIIAWSDGLTTAKGSFSVKGGRDGGDGGLIETSGHSVDFTGITIGASAAHGTGGKWLIDPTDLTIDAGAAATILAALQGGGAYVTLQTNADGTTYSSSYAGVGTAGSGNININAAIGWFTNSTLALIASNDININASLGSGSGWLVAQAGGSFNVNTGGSLNLATASVNAKNNINLTGSVVLTGISAFTAGNNFSVFSNINLGYNSTVSAGSIDLRATLTTAGGATLNSRSNISAQQIVNTGGGTLTLNSDSDGTGTGSVSFSAITTDGHVDVFYHPGSYSDSSPFPSVNGSGSITAWKLVSTPAQFAALNNLSGAFNQFYALNNDIDYSQSKTLVGGPSKHLMNTQTIQDFYGTLNGFGYAILNPVVYLLDSTSGWNGGNLGSLIGTNHGTIQNFGVVGGSFTTNLVDAAGMVITNLGTMTNVFSSASVYSAAGRAGGLVAWNNNSGLIDGGSYASGSVSALHVAGGLVASNLGIITDSYATGSVSQDRRAITSGGLVGVNEVSGQITYTYALGSVYGNSYAGGLVGVNAWAGEGAGRNGCVSGCGGRGGGYIADSYAAGFVSTGGGGSAGGLVGWLQYDVGHGGLDFPDSYNSSGTIYWSHWDAITTGQSAAIGKSYRNLFSNYGRGTVIQPSRPQFNDDYINFVIPVGDVVGAVDGPYQIVSYAYFNNPNDPATPSDTAKFSDHWYIIQGQSRPFLRAEFSTNIGNTHQLQLIDMNATASYKLMRNIDAAPPSGSTPMWAYGNFAPISPVSWTDVLTPLTRTVLNIGETIGVLNISTPTYLNFTGTFDGQGHTISNLNVAAIPVPSLTFGVGISQEAFGFIQYRVVVGTAYQTSAGLFDTVGPGGVIKNLGIVHGLFYSPNMFVGAIAGSNYGTIVGTYADAATTVLSPPGTGGLARAGGLVGVNFAGGSIFQSYASALVLGGDSSSMAGGLVGGNLGLVQDSYATGSVSGNGWVGGLVGYNGPGAYIVNTYAVGAVNVDANVGYAGRLVGQNDGTVLSSFYNSGSVLAASGGSNSSGTGLTTAQMQDLNSFAATYTGWNFASVWAPPNQANQGGLGTAYYPELYALSSVIFVQGQNTSRIYGAANPSAAASYAGGPTQYLLGPKNDGLSFAPGASSNATQFSNVGSYANTPTNGNSVTSSGGVVYRIVTKAGTLNVTPAPITVTATADQSKVYGTTSDPALGYTVTSGTLYNSDKFTGSLARAAGENAGDYAINQGTLARPSANYVLTFVGGNFTITKRQLTVSLTGSVSKIYDGTDIAGLDSTNYTLTNVLAADVASISVAGLPAAGIYDNKNAGANKAVTVNLSGVLSGAAANNYTLASTATGAIGVITPKALSDTAVITGINKSYNSTDAATGGSATLAAGNGVIAGDTVTISAGAGIYDSVNAGARTVTVTGITVGNSNYSVGTLTASGSGTISKANLTVTASTDSKVYDGLTGSSRGPQVSGTIFGPDTPSFSQAFLSKNVLGTNNSTLAASGSVTDGNNGQNYAVQFVTAVGTIAPATLTYDAVANSMIYGSTVPSLTGSVSGFVSGESMANATTGALAFDTGASASSIVGSYAIVGSGLTANNGNYRFVQAAGNANAFQVDKATLTITANDQSKIYGTAFNLGTTQFTQDGLVTTNGKGDAIAGVTLASTGAAVSATVTAPGAEYAIEASAATGSGLSNYTIIYRYAPAGLTVTPKTLTITAQDQTKTYGQLLDLGSTLFSQDGLVTSNGDSITGVTLTSAGAAASATVGGPGPVYAIVTSSANGSGLSNYSIVYQIAPTGLTVRPAPVTVTAEGGSSVYGSSPANPGLSAIGLQNNEGISVLTGLSNSFAITNHTDAGGYALTVLGLMSNPNYVVQSTVDGTWTVNRAPLTITADNASKTFGQVLTFAGTEFTSVGLKNNETIDSTTLSSFGQPAAADLVGNPYKIDISDATGGSFKLSNYQVTYVPGSLTVLPPPSLFNPQPLSPGTPRSDTNIAFQPSPVTLVSFTTRAGPAGNGTVASANPNSQADTTVTGSIDDAHTFTVNNGLTFLPISQYDATKYSTGKLPGYEARDSEATIFTMIARAVANNATGIFIDAFWDADGGDKQGASDARLLAPKVVFSDGAGQEVTPTSDNALPIVAGVTDLSSLLGKGPLMIRGATPQDGTPAQWLLAIKLTGDGKGVIANDPASGRQVVLAYDADTKTVGAVTSVLNPTTKAWVPVAEADLVKLAGDIVLLPSGSADVLKSFVPTSYLAVVIK